MSLRIWLPLTGNLNNNGIEDITISSTNATVNSGGKIGSCYSFNGSSSYLFGTQNFLSNNTEDWTFCCWMKVNNSHNGCLFSCRNNANFNGITVFYYGSQWLIDDGKRWQFTPRITIESNKWYHVCVVRKKDIGKYLYIDGELDTSTTDVGTPTNVSTAYFSIGACQQAPTTIQGNWLNGHLNDVRFYDNALSIKEIKEISKALVVHYPLNGDELAPNQNLFRVSSFSDEDLATTNFTATNDTNWSNYIRYYNGNASLHNFENGVDIISLSAQANIGIAFARLASEIDLDPSSYYTISCEAKCTKVNAHLDIGLSYYNTSDGWVWRGGSNPQDFNDVDEWQKFTLTFKPDTNTQAILYCFTVVGQSGGTDKLYIRQCKLEKSSYATSWVPNIDDVHYSVFDFDSDIENDISGYNNNGEIIGNLIRETNCPRNSYGIKFSLNTDYIRLLNMTTSGFANSYTFSWWAKYTTNYTGHMMWGFANGNRLNLYMANSGKNFYWNTGDGINNPFGSIKPSEYANGWHHFAVTGDGNVNKLYIDGEFKANATTYREITGSNIVFNGWDTSTAYKFNGSLSDFRLFATVLSEEDIKELYNIPITITDNHEITTQAEFIEGSTAVQFNKNGVVSASGSVNANLVSGTNRGEISSSAKSVSDGMLCYNSGGNGTCSVSEDNTVPVGKYSYNIVGNTTGNRDFQQRKIPYKAGKSYTGSWWAKGSGTCLYRVWDVTASTQLMQKTFTLTNEWTFYHHTFIATQQMEDDNCTFHLGVTGNSEIHLCGMKLEENDHPTPWTYNKYDAGFDIDNNFIEENNATIGNLNYITAREIKEI